MTDLQKLTKIMLLGLAAYFLLDLVLGVIRSGAYIVAGIYMSTSFWIPQVATLALMVIFAGVILYVAVYRVDSIVEKIVKGEKTSGVTVPWLPAAFRLVSVGMGILYLCHAIGAIGSSVLFTMYSAYKNMHVNFYPRAISEAVGAGLVLVLGIYLVCGAPRFVRWQVKKTVEQCRELEAFEKKTS